MSLGDPILSEAAELFLNELPEDIRNDCRDVMMNRLVDGLEQYTPTTRRGQIDRIIQGWHFRCRILNSNAIRVDTIFFSPNSPLHPMNRWGFIPP